MRGRDAGAAAVLGGLLLCPNTGGFLAAQALRGELDVRMQSVSFERFDDAPGASLVRSAPLVATLDLTAWDFGVANLSLHVRSSATDDLADAGVWPATEPPLRLIEGYLEYSVPTMTARAGRTALHTRLGYESFDGGRIDVRPAAWPLTLTAFGGWSLARGSSLPVTSPGGNPLGEFRPAERGLLAGGALRATAGPVRASAVYRREVDLASSKLASEFVAVAAGSSLFGGLSVSGGVDYDLGYGEWGSADAGLDWAGTIDGRSVGARGSARRYRPRFPLWSVWRAFSPVSYTAMAARASFEPVDHLSLHGSGERFTYGETGTESPLVTFEEAGWRWTAGAGWTGFADWSFETEFGAEFGPGAASTHARLSAAWRPTDDLRIGAWLARGTRPLEYRIDDAVVRTVGIDMRVDLGDGIAVDGGAAWQDEERTGGFTREFSHWRMRAGIRYGFGTSADRAELHPAILRIPERPTP